MANKEKEVNNGAQVGETGAEGTASQDLTVTQQKSGVGTAVKIAIGVVLTAAGTALGWFLRGLTGGGDGEDDCPDASAEAPTEE